MFSSDKKQGRSGSPSTIETLADRIDTLAHAVSSTAATLAKKDGELVATRRALEARMGDLETYVTSALQEFRTAASAAAPSPRSEKHERIDGRVVLLGEEMNTLTTKFEALASRFEATSGRVEGHDRDLQSLAIRGADPDANGAAAPHDDTLDRQLQDVLEGLAAAVERLDGQQDRIASLEAGTGSSTDSLQQRIEKLDRALAERDQDVLAALASAGERLDGQQERIISLETAGSASTDEEWGQRIEELDQALAERVRGVADELVAASGQLEAHQARIASLETAEPAAPAAADGPRKRSQDRAVERQVRTVVDGLKAATGRIELQQKEIASLTAALSVSDGEVQQRIDELGGALGEQVRRIAEDVTGAAQHLEAQQDEITELRSVLTASDGGVQQRIEELDHAFAQQVQNMLDALTTASERLEGQHERIAALEASEVGPDSTGLQQRVEELDQALAGQVQEIAEGLKAAAERIELQQERVSSLEATKGLPDEVLRRVEELDAAVRDLAVERQAAEPAASAEVESHISELGEFVLELRDMVHTLDTRMTALATDLESSLDDQRVNPEDLERHFAEAGTRFDAIVSDLRNLAHMLSTAATRDHGDLDARLDTMRDSMAAALERIELLEIDLPTANDASAPRVEQLEHELAALRARLRHTTTSEEVGSQLDALRLELAQAMTRLERTEDVASRTAYNTTSSTTRLSTTVDELAAKIGQLERLEDGLMAKLERTQALWPVALRALEGRIDDIARTREQGGASNEETLLAALQDGIATAHTVIGDDVHVGNGQPADPEPPDAPPRARRGAARRSRSG